MQDVRTEEAQGYATISARVSVVENSIQQLHGELVEIKSALTTIAASVNKSRETNWTVIFSGLVVAGALYAAAIKPLERDIERQSVEAHTLANAVLLKEEKISALQQESVVAITDIRLIKEEIKRMNEFGTTSTDKRLTLLESKASESKPK